MRFLGRYKISLLVSLLLIMGLFVFAVFFIKYRTPWDRYFEKTLYREPSSIVVEATKSIEIKGNVIDLGCGAGNETAFLLRDGWDVFAVDGDPSAIDWINSRDDLPNDNNLSFINLKFEELDWDLLPISQMVISVNALPFCKSTDFLLVWKHIKQKLSGGGLFVGHFLRSVFRIL